MNIYSNYKLSVSIPGVIIKIVQGFPSSGHSCRTTSSPSSKCFNAFTFTEGNGQESYANGGLWPRNCQNPRIQDLRLGLVSGNASRLHA